MRTRHLVGLISGVLILSVLLPVGLSIWLAHQQVETSFIEELDTYSSRVAIRANKVATQGKDALQELERWQGAACSEAHLMEMRRVSYSYRYIQEVVGFAPIFPDICYHLTHYKPAAADIPVASDNPAHYADAIRYNARTPLQGSLLPLTRLVWA